MKVLIILIIFVILITGCIGKTTNNIENENNNQNISIENISIEDTSKENINTEYWYIYTYEGPSDIENSENSRMAVIPYLRELGWNEGISVTYGSIKHSVIIALPFQLTNESINNINQTLANYNFEPVRINEIVELPVLPELEN